MTKDRQQSSIDCLPTTSELWQGPWLDWNTLQPKGVGRDSKRNLSPHVKWHFLQEWDAHYNMSMKLSIFNSEKARSKKSMAKGASEYFRNQCHKFLTLEDQVTDSWDHMDNFMNLPNAPSGKSMNAFMATRDSPWKKWFDHALEAY